MLRLRLVSEPPISTLGQPLISSYDCTDAWHDRTDLVGSISVLLKGEGTEIRSRMVVSVAEPSTGDLPSAEVWESDLSLAACKGPEGRRHL